MVFGHDPVFSEFAQYFVAGFAENLPKCSVLEAHVNRNVWRTLKPGDGRVHMYGHPEDLQDLSRRIDEMRDEVTERIHASVMGILEEFGIEPLQQDDKVIRRASEKLARVFADPTRITNATPSTGQTKRAKRSGKRP
jgi:hypothetical protein